jgi:hypothetical protein
LRCRWQSNQQTANVEISNAHVKRRLWTIEALMQQK